MVKLLQMFNFIKKFCKEWALFFFNRCQSTFAEWKMSINFHTKSVKEFLVKYWKLTKQNFYIEIDLFLRKKLSGYKKLFLDNLQQGFQAAYVQVLARVNADWDSLHAFLTAALQENIIVLTYKALLENTDYVAGYVFGLFQKDMFGAAMNALCDAVG